MQYYVRELHDKQAILIAEDGHLLSTFDCVDDAVAICIVHCRVAPLWIEWYREASVQGVDNDCIQQTLAQYFKTRSYNTAVQLASYR